jgi:hypothetical protein
MEKLLLGALGKYLGVGFVLLLYLVYAIYLKISINNLAERMENVAESLKEMVPEKVMDLRLETLVAKLDAIKEDMGEIKELIRLNGKSGGRH